MSSARAEELKAAVKAAMRYGHDVRPDLDWGIRFNGDRDWDIFATGPDGTGWQVLNFGPDWSRDELIAGVDGLLERLEQ